LVPTDGGAPIDLPATASASITNDVTAPSPVPVDFTIPADTPAGTYNLVGTLTDSVTPADTNTGDKTFSSGPVIIGGSDVLPISGTWNRATGGMDLTYRVKADLSAAETLQLYYADGPDSSSILGPSIFSDTIAAGVRKGTYHVHVPGSNFVYAPVNTTNLIAVAGENSASIKDVSIKPTGNAAAKEALGYTISDFTKRVLKDDLRIGGCAMAIITSTVRTPHEQAVAMYNNLVNGTSPTYASAGQQVVQVYYVDRRAKKSRSQTIADMEATINAVGPFNVSHHCASPSDWNQTNVVDVAPSSTNQLFFGALQQDPRVDTQHLFGPRNGDLAYHIEIPQSNAS